jgi:hypothetical protein
LPPARAIPAQRLAPGGCAWLADGFGLQHSAASPRPAARAISAEGVALAGFGWVLAGQVRRSIADPPGRLLGATTRSVRPVRCRPGAWPEAASA